MKKALLGLALVLLTALLIISPLAPNGQQAVIFASGTLRQHAASRNFLIGSAVNIAPWGNALQNDATYAQILGDQFNIAVPENAMKMEIIQPSQGNFVWTYGDTMVNFAQQRSMPVRGHALVWHIAVPSWVLNGNWTSTTLLDVMRTHINTVVTHYKNTYPGVVKYWDVVNEAVSDNGQTLRFSDSIWNRVIGSSYIDEAFLAANAADPTAKLFYNDYGGEDLGVKSNTIYNLVAGMKARGVPIHGIGLQAHVDINNPPTYWEIVDNINRLGALGLEVHITELDVKVGTTTPTQAQLDQQAQVYRTFIHACLATSNYCKAFLIWGFTDKYTWISNDAPLPYNPNYQQKPAFTALHNALAGTDGWVAPPRPQATPTSTPISTNNAARINVGSNSSYVDSSGRAWIADSGQGFVGGTKLDRGNVAISNTNDPKIYQSERYAVAGYNASVANGSYTVRLHFVEGYSGVTGAGQRVFNVNVEGQTLNGVDIYNETGGLNRALVKTFTNVNVTDGVLNMTFTATKDQSTTLSGIEIVSGTEPPPPPPTSSILSNTNMENGTAPWYGFGVGSLSSNSSSPQQGSSSLCISGRTSSWNGIGQSITTSVANNGVYTSSVWVRLASSAAATNVSVKLKVTTSSGTQEFDFGSAALTPGSWVRITSGNSINWSGTLSNAEWYVSTSSGTSDFCIDAAYFGNNLTNGNFENSTSSWYTFGSGTLSASTSSPQQGGGVGCIVGRTASWNGIGQQITSKVASNSTYYSSVWVRLASGAASTNGSVKLKITVGTTSQEFDFGSAALTPGSWVRISNITPVAWTGTLSNAEWYVSTSSGTSDFCVDAATFGGGIGSGSTTPPPATATPTVIFQPPTNTPQVPTNTPTGPVNLLQNGNIEGGTASWSCFGGCTRTAVTSPVRGGANALRVTARPASYSGPSQNLSASQMVSGATYTSSVWVRSETGTPSVKVTLKLDTTTSSNNYITLGSQTVNSTGWTQITTSVPISWTGTVTSAMWYVETNGGTDNLIIDDASFARP
jgi:endo-1,4-beta-xylanase